MTDGGSWHPGGQGGGRDWQDYGQPRRSGGGRSYGSSGRPTPGTRGEPWGTPPPPAPPRPPNPYGAPPPRRGGGAWSPAGDGAGTDARRSAPPRGSRSWAPETDSRDPGRPEAGRSYGAGGGRRGTRGPDDDQWSPTAQGRGENRAESRTGGPSGRDRRDPGPGGARTKRRTTRRRRIIKWTAIGLSGVIVAVGAFAAYVYKTTLGDIKSTALLPGGVKQSALPTDKYGNTAMNILVIGSDTRSGANCALGGACQEAQGARADSEMLLHVSADRSNATIMSLPRDTVTTVPVCGKNSSGQLVQTGTTTDMLNSALQYGPECQVLAVHMLTNVTITGYIMFDFDGVVDMSNALGGVPVCVTKAVDDKFPSSGSGLVLPAGTSVIKGKQALEFLRTRDSFFDGSDLGREEATHYFLSQLVQTMRSKMNLTSVSTLLRIGQAAAKSTTVSSNFSGISGLEGLVESLNRVPSKNITFLTMPWYVDPTNNARVLVLQPQANAMFKNIQNDVSYTNTKKKSTPKPTTPKPAAPSVDKATVRVGVYNGNGAAGRASAIASALQSDGFSQAVSVGNADITQTTMVYYPTGDATQAAAVAAALGIPSSQVQESSDYATVGVVIGTDFTQGTTYHPVASAANTAGAASAPSDSHESNAMDSSNECIPVESGTLAMAYK